MRHLGASGTRKLMAWQHHNTCCEQQTAPNTVQHVSAGVMCGLSYHSPRLSSPFSCQLQHKYLNMCWSNSMGPLETLYTQLLRPEFF